MVVLQDYKELCMKLRDIPINQYTVCELVRLCLRRKDADQDSNPDSLDSQESMVEDQEETVSCQDYLQIIYHIL